MFLVGAQMFFLGCMSAVGAMFSEKVDINDVSEVALCSDECHWWGSSLFVQQPVSRDEEEKPLKHKDAPERAQKLLGCLKDKGSVPFSVLFNSLYKGLNYSDVHWDILQLLRSGENISAENNTVSYKGPVILQTKCQDITVERAMFDLIKGGCYSLTKIKRALYCQGYVDAKPSYLSVLELALIVGGVYPGCRCVTENMRYWARFWDGLKDLTLQQFQTAIERVDGYNRRVLWCLWKLKACGELQTFEEIMQPFRVLRFLFLPKMSAWQKNFVSCWCQRPHETFLIAKILEALGMPLLNPGCCADKVLKEVLVLADGGLPIVYDKDSATVTLLDEKLPTCTPQAGTNLLTMIYALSCQYGRDISCEELAYFACYFGYEEKGQGIALKNTILLYKKYMVILGFLDGNVFAPACKTRLLRQRRFWRYIQNEAAILNAREYRTLSEGKLGFVQDADVTLMRQIRRFSSHADYTVLQRYEDLVRAGVRPPPLIPPPIRWLGKGMTA